MRMWIVVYDPHADLAVVVSAHNTAEEALAAMKLEQAKDPNSENGYWDYNSIEIPE